MNTDYWISHIASNIYPPDPPEFYLGLSSVVPNKDGSGVKEPTASNYQRIHIDKFTDFSDGKITNANDFVFSTESEQWFVPPDRVTCWVLFDNENHVLASGNFEKPFAMGVSTVLTIPANAIAFEFKDSSEGK